MAFVHLHSHTEFSILDASNKIADYVAKVKSLGMNAAAITDHGNMFGVIAMYKACMDAGIKPILGCEVYEAPISRFEKDPEERYYHLILLAENNTGFQNLSQIVTRGYTDGMYYGKPRVDEELLRTYHEGIICMSACLAGRIPRQIVKDDIDGAKASIAKYIDIFRKDNFFLEIQDHGDPNEKLVAEELYRLSKEMGVPIVATNDCHYTEKEDTEAHAVLLMIRDKITIHDPSNDYGNGQLYVKSEEEMRELFPYAPEAIDNTQKIADRCNVTIKFHDTKMPKAPVPAGMSSWDYLNQLCSKGLLEKYPDDDGTVRKQLDYELSVIQKMGFVDYFIIVAEYCDWARSHGVAVGPGRGSAAGSVATYCMGITDIDPRKYSLFFERFLNPERVSMPDIDVDFSDKNRYRVVDHVKQLYGEDNVCQIITFTTMAAKKIILSVGKAYGYPVSFYQGLASLVPTEPKMTLKKALDESVEFQLHYNENPDSKKIIDMAIKLEGLPCTTSKHAAGVIIADRPVRDYIPLAIAKTGELVSAFDAVTVEELGALKMDFLGLKTLSVLEQCIENIRDTKGMVLDLDKISMSDKAVYDFIGSGNTVGVFQLESSGMQSFMRKLRPKSLEDLIAGIALYRPGPMDYIPNYLAGKNSVSSIHYLCPQLRPILETTYNTIVYQEQVMQIFQQLAGYSLGQADNIRRAMSKKKQHVIDEERESFINGDPKRGICGCRANGISVGVAQEIYAQMVDFAKYAFNKSHSAAYAVISYQTAWLKYYYPVEYMTAIISVFCGTPDKALAYIGDARKSGIHILPPDINKSAADCTPEDGNIRMGLSAIKGVGEDVVQKILEKRKLDGPFTSFSKFLPCCEMIGANKKVIEALIMSGAFDDMPETRATMLQGYAGALTSLRDEKKQTQGQLSLFDFAGEEEGFQRIQLQPLPEYDQDTRLKQEKEATGFYISAHPLDEYRFFFNRATTKKIAALPEEAEESKSLRFQKAETIGGIITSYKKFYTKDSKPMCSFTLEDDTGEIKVLLFPSAYSTNKVEELGIGEDSKVLIQGRFNGDDEEEKFIADKITSFEKAKKDLNIVFHSLEEYKEAIPKLDKVLKTYRGSDIVTVTILGTTRMQKDVCRAFRVNEESMKTLRALFGSGHLVIGA